MQVWLCHSPLFVNVLIIVLDPAISGVHIRRGNIIALKVNDLALGLPRERQSGVAIQTLDRFDETILEFRATGRSHNLSSDCAVPGHRHPDRSLSRSSSPLTPAMINGSR